MDVDHNLLRSSTQMTSSTFNPVLIGGFLIAFPLVGILVWIAAFVSQPRGRKDFKEKLVKSFVQWRKYSSSQCLYNSLTSLLIFDLLNAGSSIAYGSGMIGDCQNSRLCQGSGNVFIFSRSLSIILHLVTALVSILHMCHPSQGNRYRYFEAAFSIVIIVICPTHVYAQHVSSIIVAVVVFVLTLAVGFKSITPVTTPSLATKKILIVVVAFISCFAVFFPSFVVECLVYYGGRDDLWLTYMDAVFYSSFNVIMDGVLCVLILSLPSGEQQQQPPPQLQLPLSQFEES